MNEKLWCTVGQHYWGRKAKRGRKPTVCPNHKEQKPTQGTTVENPMPVEKRLEKAHKAKAEKKNNRVWEQVERSMKSSECRCDLKPGMTPQDLRVLGYGCTNGYFICPALDAYRRLQGH